MPSVLIVEDDDSLQRLYKVWLSMAGYSIIGVANNGEEAVNLYRSLTDKPDVILMDFRMPKKDGLEAAKEILQINGRQKIVLATGDEYVIKQAKNLGIRDYKIKPFDGERLLNNLKEYLACK